MNNQPLPKPTQKTDSSSDAGATMAAPPSAMGKPPASAVSPVSSTTAAPTSSTVVATDLAVGSTVSAVAPSAGPTVTLDATKNQSNLPKPVNAGATSTPANGTKLPADDKKDGVVFDGGIAKSRIPLAQKDNQKAMGVKEETKLPPTSLSALSSMSSNAIPGSSSGKPASIPVAGAEQIIKPSNKLVMPERTVLGRPIPQSIRGEDLPKGLRSNVPAPKIVDQKSAPMPEISKDSSAPNQGNQKPQFAAEKKSPLKFLPLILGGLALVAVIGLVVSKLFGGGSSSLPKTVTSTGNNTSAPTTNTTEEVGKRTEVPSDQVELTYWGLWEPDEVVDGIISDFETANPGVKINYVKQSHKDYRERLQTALGTATGPDIFRFHASWTPMLKTSLAPVPSSVISPKDFKDNYYPIVTDQLVVEGQYVGVPLMYDGLALYYNEDILESANEVAPSTWAELRVLANKLTVRSANGIQRAGLAIGNATNVDHFSDILAILMLQNGADFTKPNSQETVDALTFYTNFVLKDEVWDNKFPSSTVAFARGDVAMMFAPSWRAHEIKAQNPELKFKTMTLPQLSDERIAWGSYWAEGVNTNSKNKEMAAKFLGFLSSDENLMKLYSKASEIRAFGEIYPKASMAEKLVDDEIVSTYLDDAVYAKNWYLNSFTHDNGLNDQLISYYRDGVTGLIEGEKIEDVMVAIESGTKQVLKQYAVSSK
ncbi:extracellular solute-binding protein [Candidatus Woesebacteria bacterium]|nr:extracellular solute-binding protein [Candidatus Woesebacteria bacterium]